MGLEFVLKYLPDPSTINVGYTIEALQPFLDYVKMVIWMLPSNTIMQIISLVISFHLIKIVTSLVRTIWDLLPVL